MLLNLKEIIEKNGIKLKSIIHCGGHYGQEFEEYKANGANKVVFIEPCTDAYSKLKEKFGNNPDVALFNCAVGNYTGMSEMFTSKDNLGMSNSLLKPMLHTKQHPEIVFNSSEMVTVRRLDDLDIPNKSDYNMLAMDCQGFEFEILKGGVDTLKNIDIILTEVNKNYLYENCGLIHEIDAFLSDFIRVETSWAGATDWGDAAYIAKRILNK